MSMHKKVAHHLEITRPDSWLVRVGLNGLNEKYGLTINNKNFAFEVVILCLESTCLDEVDGCCWWVGEFSRIIAISAPQLELGLQLG